MEIFGVARVSASRGGLALLERVHFAWRGRLNLHDSGPVGGILGLVKDKTPEICLKLHILLLLLHG